MRRNVLLTPPNGTLSFHQILSQRGMPSLPKAEWVAPQLRTATAAVEVNFCGAQDHRVRNETKGVAVEAPRVGRVGLDRKLFHQDDRRAVVPPAPPVGALTILLSNTVGKQGASYLWMRYPRDDDSPVGKNQSTIGTKASTAQVAVIYFLI
jgi:hypothetical protein